MYARIFGGCTFVNAEQAEIPEIERKARSTENSDQATTQVVRECFSIIKYILCMSVCEWVCVRARNLMWKESKEWTYQDYKPASIK